MFSPVSPDAPPRGCLRLLRQIEDELIPDRYVRRGLASWYGDAFDGKPTASGEPFDSTQVTTAPYGATKRPRLVARIAEAGSVAGRGCSPSPQDMPDALHVLVLPVAGWVNRPPDNQIAYLREEQRGLRAWRLGWARRVPVVGRGGTQRWHPTQCAH